MHGREEGVQQCEMVGDYNKWGEIMGKGEVDGLRTVDCLRGRLLAERVASKAAKEKAELMSKRLIELEKLLAIEIEARNRAEKRLKRLLKKLETLKILDVSSQSNVSEASGSSSSTCFAGLQMQEEQKPNSQAKKSTQCDAEEEKMEETQDLLTSEDLGDETSDDLSANSVDQSISQEDSWGSSHNKSDPCPEGPEQMVESKDSFDSGESRTDTTRESSICRKEIDGAEHQTEEEVEETLNLFPARMGPNSNAASEPRHSSEVQSVLVAVRRVTEHLQNSVGRRDVVC